jgi:hypothetical protein
MIIFNIVFTTRPLSTDKGFTKIAIMTENELKQELSSMKKNDLLHLIESLMEDGVIGITDINLCHTRALESKLAVKDKIIHDADICIFESVFTDSLGKPADDRALLRKLEWMDKVGMHNMKGIMEYLKDNKNEKNYVKRRV